MNSLERHLGEIKETQRQMSATKSPKRKRDLQKHLDKLWAEYRAAKRFMREAGVL